MRSLDIQFPGLFTTVQDLGRTGYGPLWVSASGAADSTALRVANILVGNREGSPALEMTLRGGQFLFPEGALVAFGGSDFSVAVEGQPIALWTTNEVLCGQCLTCGGSRTGARCYLCVRGGVCVPMVLGSASTDVLCGMGGFGGRVLRRGDRLEIGPEPVLPPRSSLNPDLRHLLGGRQVFRVTDGPQCEWFTPATADIFYNSTYSVTSDANRMGIRLAGPQLSPKFSCELITEGVSLGSIQITGSGQPVILFVEQQTTGGYPKIANVIAADLPALGQLKPGDQIRFQRVDVREARELLYIQERWITSSNSYL